MKKMDKTKINLIVIAILVIICLSVGAYASGLNGQLNLEKTRSAQLNDQIKGLNLKVSGLETQLSGAISRANDQASLVANLESSLNAALSEVNNLKAVNSELEAKLQSAISNASANAQEAVTGALPSIAPAKQ